MLSDCHFRLRRLAWSGAALLMIFAWPHRARGQDAPVTGTVEVANAAAGKSSGAASGVLPAADAVVWLVPLDKETAEASTKSLGEQRQLMQRNKSFEPHVLVVRVGSVVQFPNKDPFFHNVFSLFDGKRFDLGLYEAGSSNSVRFDRPGISYLFCNIHPEMSAAIVVVPTSYFAVSDASGKWSIPGVPDGPYRFHFWYERSTAEDLEKLQQAVEISQTSRSLGTTRVAASNAAISAHKNKYGKDYVPPGNPAYTNPW